MGCRTSGLSDKWDVGQVGCRRSGQPSCPTKYDLSDKWDVGQVGCRTSGCRTSGMSDKWATQLSDIPVVRQMSDNWAVGQLGCLTSDTFSRINLM